MSATRSGVTRAASGLRTEVLTRVEDVAPHVAAWDELAALRDEPFCAPAWMLSWWNEARSGDARLRLVLVHDDDGLAGVGPFFAQVGPFGLAEYRLLSAGFCHRIGVLARPGREGVVAAELARVLSAASPPPASVVFEGIDLANPWPALLAKAWPGGRRPRVRTDTVMEAPVVSLHGDFDAWMARRGRKFRKEARRTARRLEEAGVRPRVAHDDAAVEALMRLHEARWQDRGGSHVDDAATRVVTAALRALDGSDRIAVALLDGPDGPISAELVVRAGGRLVFWSGGFDPAWSKHAPGTQAMLVALERAAGEGVEIADLGGGAHEYKRRLADENRPIAWRTLFPRGPRHLAIRARLAPKHLRWALRDLVRRLPEERRDQLLALRARVKRTGRGA